MADSRWQARPSSSLSIFAGVVTMVKHFAGSGRRPPLAARENRAAGSCQRSSETERP